MAKVKMILIHALCLFIRIYQVFLSRLFPSSCRFYPSCSHYALEALQKKGLLMGMYYILKRLFRCHPWYQGGYDPVEPNEENKTWI